MSVTFPLEHIRQRHAAFDSLLLPGVACYVEIQAPGGVFAGGEGGTQFQSGAAAAGIGSADGQAVHTAFCLAVEFMLVGKVSVELPPVTLHGVAHAQTEDMAIDGIQVVVVTGSIEVHAALAVEDIPAVDVHYVAMGCFELLANTQAEAQVAGTFVVAIAPDVVPQEVVGTFVDAACTEAAVYVKAILRRPFAQKPGAGVFRGAVSTLGVFIECGEVALAMFHKGAVFKGRILVLALAAHCQDTIPGIDVHMATGFLAQFASAYLGVAGQAVCSDVFRVEQSFSGGTDVVVAGGQGRVGGRERHGLRKP